MIWKLTQFPSSAIISTRPSPDIIIHARSWWRSYRHTKIAVLELLNQIEHEVEVTESFALHTGGKSSAHSCSLSAASHADVQDTQRKSDR